MELFAGTSGFSYKEWKGEFYPPDLAEKKMLAYYAERLPAVEINNSFYRMPKGAMLANWRAGTSDAFRFVLKAPRRITHIQRLRDCADLVRYFYGEADNLGDKLGPVLFQTPPFLKKDVPLLQDFLAILPPERLAAFEFRNASWFSDDVYAALTDREAALCGGDVDDAAKSPPFVATAPWGYLRLRREEYEEGAIAGWAERIRAQAWKAAYVFFKHEKKGPELAMELGRAFGAPFAA